MSDTTACIPALIKALLGGQLSIEATAAAAGLPVSLTQATLTRHDRYFARVSGASCWEWALTDIGKRHESLGKPPAAAKPSAPRPRPAPAPRPAPVMAAPSPSPSPAPELEPVPTPAAVPPAEPHAPPAPKPSEPEEYPMQASLSNFAAAVLVTLAGGPLTRQALAEKMGARPTGLGRSLQRLKALGLVKMAGEDGEISLTAAGAKRRAECDDEGLKPEVPTAKTPRSNTTRAMEKAGLVVLHAAPAPTIHHLRVVRTAQAKAATTLEASLLGEVLDHLLSHVD